MLSLSPSSFQSFLHCPAKWKAQYIDRVKVESSEEAVLGTVVHRAMQLIAENDISVEEAFKQANILTDTEMFLDAPSILEYLNSIVDPTSVLRFTDGSPCVEKTFIRNPWEDLEVQVKGVIDRVQINESSIEVIDFKTGHWYPSSEELRFNPQATFYTLMALELAKELGYEPSSVMMTFVLARQRVAVSRPVDLDSLDLALEFYRGVAQRILASISNGRFPEKLNSYCTYCPVSSGCSAYAEVCNTQETNTDQSTLSTTDLLAAYRETRAKRKIIDDKLSAQRDLLIRSLGEGYNEVLDVDGAKVVVSVQSRKERRVNLNALIDNLSPEIRSQLLASNELSTNTLLRNPNIPKSVRDTIADLSVEGESSTVLQVKG